MLKSQGKRSHRRQNHPRHVLALLNSLKTGGIWKGLPESGSAGRPAELRGRLFVLLLSGSWLPKQQRPGK